MGALGFILFLLGAGGMDDIVNRPIATAYILVGLVCIIIEYLKEKSSAHHRPR